jgi:hypothetical protein
MKSARCVNNAQRRISGGNRSQWYWQTPHNAGCLCVNSSTRRSYSPSLTRFLSVPNSHSISPVAGKAPFSIGKIPPTPVLVDQYFDDSTGERDEGETDGRGPWNEGGDWQIVEVPELKEGVENLESLEGEEPIKMRRASSSGSKTRKSA